MERSSLSVVIPCYNEEDSVAFVLSRLNELRFRPNLDLQVIAVDDGSSDQTVQKLAAFPWVEIIRHEKTMGYGAALKSGFKKARGEHIAFFDMDSTYDPRDLESCLVLAERGRFDIVYGVRPFWGQSGMPLIRALGNFCFSKLVRALFGAGVDDIATGFRVFRRERLPEVLQLGEKKFDFGFSFTIWTLKKRWSIGQTPIRYTQRVGESKLNALKDGFIFFRVVWRMLAR